MNTLPHHIALRYDGNIQYRIAQGIRNAPAQISQT
jgi:hypothetical protein